MDDAMDVDGGWDEDPPEDDRSSGNDAGDAMEVDAEVVREALRTLSAARGHGGKDDPEGDSAWPGTWPGMWPGTRSETGAGSRSALSAPFAPNPRTLAAVAPQISAPSREPPRAAEAAVPSGPRELTVVPDTNALVSRGDKSLSVLLDRFGSNQRTDRDPARVRLAVPRRVVQELDGLKSARRGHREVAAGDDDGENRVAALARGVNRALVARLDAQHRGVDARVATSSASLEVQGPGDAAAARLEMRARGFLSTNAEGPAGDEEILFFCRTRRERGELVAFITADANAAVSAMSHASTRDVPVRAFHPEHLPADADEMHAALVAFYEAAAARGGAFAAATPSATYDAEASAPSSSEKEKKGSRGPASPSALNPSVASARDGGALESASKASGPPTTTTTGGLEGAKIPPGGESPRTHARRVLAALDEALPAAVEAMLRDELGDLWAAGVRDDFDPSHSEHLALSADEAFEALRRNLASLAAGAFAKTFQKRTPRGGPDAGREAMRALAAARRARGRHDESRQLGSVERAAEIAETVGNLLAGCPDALPEVRAAAAAAARAARALARTR